MSKWTKVLTVIAGFTMVLVSMIFTIKLLAGFAETGFEQGLYAVFGFAVQAAQTVFLSIGLYHWYFGNKGKAMPAFLTYVVLFGLSLLGTIGYFSVTNREKLDKELVSDSRYVAMQQEIDAIDAQAATLQGQIADYQARNWITKGVKPTQEKLDALMQRRNQTVDKLDTYEPVPTADAMYLMLANFFGERDVDKIKFIVFVLYALVLDLGGALCLYYGLEDEVSASLEQPATGESTQTTIIDRLTGTVTLSPDGQVMTENDTGIKFDRRGGGFQPAMASAGTDELTALKRELAEIRAQLPGGNADDPTHARSLGDKPKSDKELYDQDNEVTGFRPNSNNVKELNDIPGTGFTPDDWRRVAVAYDNMRNRKAGSRKMAILPGVTRVKKNNHLAGEVDPVKFERIRDYAIDKGLWRLGDEPHRNATVPVVGKAEFLQHFGIE